MSRLGPVARRVFTERLCMAVHVVRLTLVAKKACSGGKLEVVALITLASEGLEVGINMFAGVR